MANQVDLSSVVSAAREGLRRVIGSVGGETDPDLRLYQQLKPGDFPKLIQKYGAEGVTNYINEMEQRLKKRGAK